MRGFTVNEKYKMTEYFRLMDAQSKQKRLSPSDHTVDMRQI
jgi:hypothetical protein